MVSRRHDEIKITRCPCNGCIGSSALHREIMLTHRAVAVAYAVFRLECATYRLFLLSSTTISSCSPLSFFHPLPLRPCLPACCSPPPCCLSISNWAIVNEGLAHGPNTLNNSSICVETRFLWGLKLILCVIWILDLEVDGSHATSIHGLRIKGDWGMVTQSLRWGRPMLTSPQYLGKTLYSLSLQQWKWLNY